MLPKLNVLFFITILTSYSLAQSIITVKDDDILPGATYNMTANNIYLLDGFVFVEDNSVLNIEAGTVIKGKEVPTTGDNASALIIARGGKIFANGTAQNPIIFTAEVDDLNDPQDLIYSDRGFWGGVIILGRSIMNTTSGEGQIEGIPSTNPRGTYGGGLNPILDDNSGVFRYVSIRHGGAEIGAGNEINGLTMGAVGSGTTIEFVEVFANVDDSFEWFGGTVNTKYLVSAFPGDDSFDYDEGWTGNNQFWFAIHDADEGGGRIGEHDGGTNPVDGQPYAIPVIYNATYIGPGSSALPQGDGGQAIIFRDNAGGKFYNSIITEYNGGNGGVAVTIQDQPSGEDSRARLEAGDLVLSHNIWWQFGAGNDLNSIIPQDFVRPFFTNDNNEIVDPQINNISRTYNSSLDPRPSASGPAASGAITPVDPFFTATYYRGAFEPDAPLWISGWTALAATGLTDVNESFSNTIPESFTLSQNYPNPFNPTTTIVYSLIESGNVKLSVHNILGQEVAQLVNGFRNSGTYEVTFDAENLPSGLYLYTMEAGSVKITKKMTLLK
jgi:hypothetical protein